MYRGNDLYKALIRHQFAVDAIRYHLGSIAVHDYSQLERDIKSLILGVRYSTLDEMSRSALNKLCVELRSVINARFNTWAIKLYKDLQDFMQADIRLQTKVLASVHAGTDEPMSDAAASAYLGKLYGLHGQEAPEAARDSGLWLPVGIRSSQVAAGGAPMPTGAGLTGLVPAGSGPILGASPVIAYGTLTSAPLMWEYIQKQFISASGYTPQQQLDNLTGVTTARVITQLNRAWTNGLTPRDAVDIVLPKNMENLLTAVTDTLTQNVTSHVSYTVGSVFTKVYTWVSVMDSRTTEICKSRNGLIFFYGSGPIPPAHFRCRSRTIPGDQRRIAPGTVSGLKSPSRSMSVSQFVNNPPDLLQ